MYIKIKSHKNYLSKSSMRRFSKIKKKLRRRIKRRLERMVSNG